MLDRVFKSGKMQLVIPVAPLSNANQTGFCFFVLSIPVAPLNNAKPTGSFVSKTDYLSSTFHKTP